MVKSLVMYKRKAQFATTYSFFFSFIGMRVCQEVGFNNFIHSNGPILPVLDIFLFYLQIVVALVLARHLTNASSKTIGLEPHIVGDRVELVHQAFDFEERVLALEILLVQLVYPEFHIF